MLITHHLQEYLPEQNENIKRTQEKPAKSENLHERQAYHLETSDADKTVSNAWLRPGELLPETIGFVTAIEVQVISTDI